MKQQSQHSPPIYQIHLIDLLFPYIRRQDRMNWMLTCREFRDRFYFKIYSEMEFKSLSLLKWLDNGTYNYTYSIDLSDIPDSLADIPKTWLKQLLYKCFNLTILNLSNCWFLTDETIYPLIIEKTKQNNIFLSLSSLDVSRTAITDKSLTILLNSLPNLKRLCLNDVSCIGPLFKSFIWEKRLLYIYELVLNNNQDVDDEFLVIITRNCPSLSKLSISKCNVTDYGVSHCLTLPHLWHINLAFCSKVTNQILTNLIHPKLLGFQAIGTKMVFDDFCLKKLSIHCLETLIIGYNEFYPNKTFMLQFDIPFSTSISTYSEPLLIGNPQVLPIHLKYFYFLRRILVVIEEPDLYFPPELIQMYIDMASVTLITTVVLICKGHGLVPIDITSLKTAITGPKYINGIIKTTLKHIDIIVYKDWVDTNHVQFKLN